MEAIGALVAKLALEAVASRYPAALIGLLVLAVVLTLLARRKTT